MALAEPLALDLRLRGQVVEPPRDPAEQTSWVSRPVLSCQFVEQSGDPRLRLVVERRGRPPDGREFGWAKEKADSVDRFKANEVPLLVGTKAFGMGIDKPNIRYTIHAGMPSSLEAFAQEAGRAGRSDKRALCTLVAILPEPEIAEQVLSADLSPKERKGLVKRLSDLRGADIRRQGFFLTNSFPGVADEVVRAIETLGRLGGLPQPRSVITIPLPRAFPGADKAARHRLEDERSALDRALHRLAMAGVIADLTVDGAEATVHVADWTNASLDAALVEYLTRIEPGRRDLQIAEVAAGPPDSAARIEHHISMLIEATYGPYVIELVPRAEYAGLVSAGAYAGGKRRTPSIKVVIPET